MQAEQQSELLPCPFCGAVGLDFTEGSTFRWLEPSCTGCGATSGEVRVQTLGEGTTEQWLEAAKKDAIAAWNRRAALSHPSTPQGWQPIESAPKDGTPVLAFWPPSITFHVHGGCYGVASFLDGDWCDPEDSEDTYIKPSRWMPLPPPPQVQGDKT